MGEEKYLDNRLLVFRRHFSEGQSADAFSRLHRETRWQRPGYDNDGRITYLPRLTANYGERSYDYSGLVFTPEPWTPLLLELKTHAERASGERFNAAIVQLYRDGNDGVNWHSDDSPAVG